MTILHAITNFLSSAAKEYVQVRRIVVRKGDYEALKSECAELARYADKGGPYRGLERPMQVYGPFGVCEIVGADE